MLDNGHICSAVSRQSVHEGRLNHFEMNITMYRRSVATAGRLQYVKTSGGSRTDAATTSLAPDIGHFSLQYCGRGTWVQLSAYEGGQEGGDQKRSVIGCYK